MEDQKRELIKAGVPCAILYANLAQEACVQEKIFEEIACGLIKVLFVTPEKLVSNEGFCRFITRLYEQQKVRFVIDEAHCIIAYQDFREAWGRLGILKQRWKLAPIMLLTATCTQSEVDEIRANLAIEEDNFAIICSSTSHRPEIIFNVQERKEIRDQYINDIIDIINANLLGHIIIYCATHFSCEYLYSKLQENLTDVSIGYFHGSLRDDERETTMNNWTSNQIQIMVATSAFGMGINSSNIHVVIHVGAPMSITNLIQEAGCAGHDGNTATNVIFYSKKDVCINYSIVAEHREIVSMIEEQRLINKLDQAATKIFEVFYYCNSRYECCQQLIWQYQASQVEI
ncbi:Sgs1p [Rhizophagus irregularis DAOM 197198w]|uniref:DNA 3'-5' helicase n=1 Tax=Rhizophagus irregularis (strain DAOM 197198w) TaxID=1432141 RepID=A0A015J509_RHIIW|nr:Sgs1p [Rhizophagus irregularis DAOM 197198w]